MTQISVGNDYTFELPPGPIGLSFSTGIDSTLLLYLLLSQTDEEIHLFTVAVKSRQYHVMKYSSDIIAYVIDLVGPKNIIQHTILKDSAQDGVSGLYDLPYNYYAEKKLVNSVLTGHNSLPDLEDVDLGWPPRDSHEFKIRSPYETREVNFREEWYSPLTNYNKRKIAELFLHYDILELAKLTNSCYTKYNEDPCKQCFACKEKFWGFGFY